MDFPFNNKLTGRNVSVFTEIFVKNACLAPSAGLAAPGHSRHSTQRLSIISKAQFSLGVVLDGYQTPSIHYSALETAHW